MGNEVTPIDVGAISVPLSSAMAARVSARARKHKQNLTEAVDALLVLAFRNIDAASIGGHKRWDGVSAEQRSALGRKAVEARWRKEARDDLTVEQILAWADAHHKRTRKWPSVNSGAVDDAPGETWVAINQALYKGGRGLPKGSSLSKLLVEHGRK